MLPTKDDDQLVKPVRTFARPHGQTAWMKDDKELLKPVRAFAMIDMSKSRGYEALQKGEIPYVRVAGQLRIPRRWIEEQVENALAGAAPERAR